MDKLRKAYVRNDIKLLSLEDDNLIIAVRHDFKHGTPWIADLGTSVLISERVIVVALEHHVTPELGKSRAI